VNIHPVGAESFHADGQTEMTKPKVTIRNFTNALNLSETCKESQFSAPVLERESTEYGYWVPNIRTSKATRLVSVLL